MNARDIIVIKVCVWTMWPVTAYATAITIGETLVSVPLLAWLMVLLLSTVSGTAALLNRLKLETPSRPVMFAISHMMGSWVSGALTFLAAEAFDVHDMTEAVAIGLAAYSGAKLMDRWSDRFVDHVSSSKAGAP
jgi:hypothetical protein